MKLETEPMHQEASGTQVCVRGVHVRGAGVQAAGVRGLLRRLVLPRVWGPAGL